MVYLATIAQNLCLFIPAPEKIIHEKLKEEIEMEMKGTVTNDVTLNNWYQ